MVDASSVPATPTLYLLFPRGQRPDRGALQAALSNLSDVTITHESGKQEMPQSGSDWLELLLDGMTFDLSGLAPSPAVSSPSFRHRFDITEQDCNDSVEVLNIVCGPHLAAGASQPPVMRAQLRLASLIAPHLPHLTGVGWSPSGGAMSSAYFTRIVSAWLNSGPFPGLGLIGYHAQADGSLISEGMAVWSGQELHIESSVAEDRLDATRLAVRLANQLVAMGPLEQVEQVTGPEGNTLRLSPSDDGLTIRVSEG